MSKSNHFILSDWNKTTKMFPQLHVCDCGCMKGDGIIVLVNLHEANTWGRSVIRPLETLADLQPSWIKAARVSRRMKNESSCRLPEERAAAERTLTVQQITTIQHKRTTNISISPAGDLCESGQVTDRPRGRPGSGVTVVHSCCLRLSGSIWSEPEPESLHWSVRVCYRILPSRIKASHYRQIKN